MLKSYFNNHFHLWTLSDKIISFIGSLIEAEMATNTFYQQINVSETGSDKSSISALDKINPVIGVRKAIWL